MARQHMTVDFADRDELPDGPGVYIVWSALGGAFGLAGLGNRPLYIGMTKRSVEVRMREHIRKNDLAVPSFESAAEIEYIQCHDENDARDVERQLQNELDPFYGTG
jgi:excinuclease UvrABC nuclease subunit